MNYYKKAAEQGYAESQYNLGIMYAYGRGGPIRNGTSDLLAQN
jgi:TPR repeat protein